jgi:transcriptional regulator with XRE-family HTH domain
MARARQDHGQSSGARRQRAPHGAFGARLAKLRASHGLTQIELARRLHVSRRQIAYYESGHGRPPGALLAGLADLFGISTDALLGRTAAGDAVAGSGALRARLLRIDRLGPAAGRRLAAVLDRFIVGEQRRGSGRSPARRKR